MPSAGDLLLVDVHQDGSDPPKEELPIWEHTYDLGSNKKRVFSPLPF
jgi:hypothetical protein